MSAGSSCLPRSLGRCTLCMQRQSIASCNCHHYGRHSYHEAWLSFSLLANLCSKADGPILHGGDEQESAEDLGEHDEV